MKKIYLAVIALLSLLPLVSNAQWTQGSGTIYTTNSVGIGTTVPISALQLGDFANGTANNQLLIPGAYNFEQVRLGQIGNGNAALEFVNHLSTNPSYGIRFLVDVDHGAPGMQLQYAPFGTSYNTLSYTTGLYMNISGYIGIGTTKPIGKLDVRGSTFIGTSDLVIGSTGSFAQIDQGTATGNSFTQIRAFSNGGNATNNLILQNSGGNVGLGTTSPDEKLTVYGKIHSQEVKVDLSVLGPDYVFEPDYKLKSLTDLKVYVDKNHHLPEIPSATEMAKNGIDLGVMNTKLLKKVEELTLYLIEQKEEIDQLKQVVKNLQPKK